MSAMPPMSSENILVRLRALQATTDRLLRETASTSRTLENATIGRGGLIVKDGGTVRVIGPTTMFTGEQGRAGMATIGVDGAPTTPSQVQTVDGFIADAGGGVFGGLRFNPALGCWDISATGGFIRIPYTSTSASANANLNLDGAVRMSTSSRRWKQDIEDADLSPALVDGVRVVIYHDKAEMKADPSTARWYVGVIAEEAHDAGLGLFVDVDQQGQINAFQYDRYATAVLTTALQDARKRIKDLEAKAVAAARPRWSLLGFTASIAAKGYQDVTLTFPTPMPDTDYRVSFGQGHSANPAATLAVAPGTSKTKTSVTVRVTGLVTSLLAPGQFMTHVYYPEA